MDHRHLRCIYYTNITLLSGTNSVRFPKFGLKINQEGIEHIQDGTKLAAGEGFITPDLVKVFLFYIIIRSGM